MMSSQPSNSSIAVLGAGESGLSAAGLLAGEGHRVCVFDSGSETNSRAEVEALREKGVFFEFGSDRIERPGDYAWAVLSPGIDPKAPIAGSLSEAGVELIGEVELAFRRCACPVVAVTGTNGKTTTTQLVDAMFNGAGVSSVACGNIGPSFSREVHRSAELDVMTLEVSSFQLETIRTFRPKIAVWLNFTADHLDRYASMSEYFEAKARIFENLRSEDVAVVNARDVLPAMAAKQIRFSAYERGGDFELVEDAICFRGEVVLRMGETQLRGAHNAENLMAALGVGFAWGIPWQRLVEPLKRYQALPHRCEVVGSVDGVEYINDSKATNLDALEKALISEGRRVVLIAGGKDKGFEFGSVTELVAARCRAVVLIGEMSARIEGLWGGAVRCYAEASLEEAVRRARALAMAGDVVLLSPGTSSFDMFKNYADRGNQFRSAVQNLSSPTLQTS